MTAHVRRPTERRDAPPAGDRTGGRVDAVVVLHRPEPETTRRCLSSTLPQVDRLVLVGTPDDIAAVLDPIHPVGGRRSTGEDPGPGGAGPEGARLARGCVETVELPCNLGLAGGQNAGIRHALGQAPGPSPTHVLLLDQDSIPQPGMVDALLQVERGLKRAGIRPAAVGPVVTERSTGREISGVHFGRSGPSASAPPSRADRFPVDLMISSGSLIAVDVLDEVGEMDEELFVYHVDTAWLLRARSSGMRPYIARDAEMIHELAEGGMRLWWGRGRTVSLYGAHRLYYITRNSLLLFRRAGAPRRWVLQESLRLMKMFLAYLLFSPTRRAQIAMMARGALDGLRGRTGSAPFEPARSPSGRPSGSVS